MFDIVRNRKWFFLVSLVVMIPGIIAIALGGLKPNIDFTGGTIWDIRVKQEVSTEQVKRIMNENGHPDAQITRSTQTQDGRSITSMVIRTSEIGSLGNKVGDKPQLAQAFTRAGILDGKLYATGNLTDTGTISGTGTVSGTNPTVVPTVVSTSSIAPSNPVSGSGVITPGLAITPTAALSDNAEISFDSVGAAVGSEVTWLAVLAVAAASIGILLYLYYAFRKVEHPLRFGLCAIAAVLHDVIVVVGFFAILGLLFGVQVDALFITALLTVVGFSVHDTIVVFDRIRENAARRLLPTYEQIVNHSLLQTLARSLNTSLTVIFTLLALYLFGGLTIRNFVLALLIGIISGTYSSIFNASLLLVVWEKGWGFRNPPAAPPPTAATRTRAAA